MADFIAPVLTIAGGAFFGPWGAVAGSMIGGFIGGQLADPIKGPQLNDLRVQSSSYGADMPELWGTIRCAGNMIWAEDITEHEHDEGGKGGGPEVTTYTYTGCWAIVLADTSFTGPMTWIKRVWFNGKLVIDLSPCTAEGGVEGGAVPGYDLYQQLTILRGETDHTPLARMEAKEGSGNVPGYRDSIIILFEDINLTDYGNAIPSVEVEVVMNGCVAYDQCCPALIDLAWDGEDPGFSVGENSVILKTVGGSAGDRIWIVSDVGYYWMNGLQEITAPGDTQILYSVDPTDTISVVVSDWCSSIGGGVSFVGDVLGLCDSAGAVEWDTDNSAETIIQNGSSIVLVIGGVVPYTFSITSGSGYTFSGGVTVLVTNSNNVEVYADGTSCGGVELSVTDNCGSTDSWSLRNTTSGDWVEKYSGYPNAASGFYNPWSGPKILTSHSTGSGRKFYATATYGIHKVYQRYIGYGNSKSSTGSYSCETLCSYPSSYDVEAKAQYWDESKNPTQLDVVSKKDIVDNYLIDLVKTDSYWFYFKDADWYLTTYQSAIGIDVWCDPYVQCVSAVMIIYSDTSAIWEWEC